MLWSKSLETGLPVIDEQHQELFRRAELLMDRSQANRIPETLDFLEDYVVTHFSTEEALHRQTGYPKAVQHKNYHDTYKRTFKQLKEQYNQQGETLVTTLAIYNNVMGWLRDHIMVHDMEYAKFYQAQEKAKR